MQRQNTAQKIFQIWLPMIHVDPNNPGQQMSHFRDVIRLWINEIKAGGKIYLTDVRQYQQPWRAWIETFLLRRRDRRCWTYNDNRVRMLNGRAEVRMNVLTRDIDRLARQLNVRSTVPMPLEDGDRTVSFCHFLLLYRRVPAANWTAYLQAWQHHTREYQAVHRCGNGRAVPANGNMCCCNWRHLLRGTDFTNNDHKTVHLLMANCVTIEEYNTIRRVYERVEPGANLF